MADFRDDGFRPGQVVKIEATEGDRHILAGGSGSVVINITAEDSGFWFVESVSAGRLGVRRATDEEIAAALREGRGEVSRPGRDSRAR